LEQFYEHQKATWEKLRKAHERFSLNRLELAKDTQAGPALGRMHEILTAASPFGLIKEVEGLIATAGTVNAALVTARREQAIAKINGHIATLTKDIETANGDAGLRSTCLRPLEALRDRVPGEDSLAHITQSEAEALKEFDAANFRIETFVKRAEDSTKVVLKKKRVVEPAKFVQSPHLETQADVDGFLDRLRMELEQAIANEERIEIR
jgi:hypothetical protein